MNRILTPVPVRGGMVNATSTLQDLSASVLDRPFLAADVGGTFARVALVRRANGDGRELEILAYRKLACADFDGLPQLLQSFVDSDARTSVRHCVLACAGHVKGDEVMTDNSPWSIRLTQLKQTMRLDDVAVLNDFEALGYAFGEGAGGGSRLLCGPDIPVNGSILVIGPGTGLGAAVRLPSSAGGAVLATEAGQMDFAPHSVREREVLAHLAPEGGYVAYERIVSGPGLITLYEILCAMRGETRQFATPEAVTAAAAAGLDDAAAEAVEIFFGSLGSFAGSLAMSFMTAGGVYLAGGFLHAMFGALQHSAFEERFLHGRSVRAFLSQVPVWVTEHGQQGVVGAARWYLERGAPWNDEGVRRRAGESSG